MLHWRPPIHAFSSFSSLAGRHRRMHSFLCLSWSRATFGEYAHRHFSGLPGVVPIGVAFLLESRCAVGGTQRGGFLLSAALVFDAAVVIVLGEQLMPTISPVSSW
jgi:hypothetical protein